MLVCCVSPLRQRHDARCAIKYNDKQATTSYNKLQQATTHGTATHSNTHTKTTTTAAKQVFMKSNDISEL